jgi:hypothetical protein
MLLRMRAELAEVLRVPPLGVHAAIDDLAS